MNNKRTSQESIERLLLQQTQMQKERARLQAALRVAYCKYEDYKCVSEIMAESQDTEVMKNAAPNYREKVILLRQTIVGIIGDKNLFEYYKDIELAFDYILNELEDLEEVFEKVANQ